MTELRKETDSEGKCVLVRERISHSVDEYSRLCEKEAYTVRESKRLKFGTQMIFRTAVRVKVCKAFFVGLRWTYLTGCSETFWVNRHRIRVTRL